MKVFGNVRCCEVSMASRLLIYVHVISMVIHNEGCVAIQKCQCMSRDEKAKLFKLNIRT